MKESGELRTPIISNAWVKSNSGGKIGIAIAGFGRRRTRTTLKNMKKGIKSNARNICGNICASTGQPEKLTETKVSFIDLTNSYFFSIL